MASSRGSENICSGGPCSRIRPSSRNATRFATSRANPISWVAITIVMPAGGQLPDRVQHLGDEDGVQGARDLVEEHHVGVQRERPRDRDALLLATGEPVGIVVAPCPPGRTVPSSSVAFVRASVCDRPSAFSCASVTFRITVMCGNRLNAWNTIPIRRRTAFWSTPGAVISIALDPDAAGVDRFQEVDAPEQCRLAGTARPDQTRRPRGPRPRGRSLAAPRAPRTTSVGPRSGRRRSRHGSGLPSPSITLRSTSR